MSFSSPERRGWSCARQVCAAALAAASIGLFATPALAQGPDYDGGGAQQGHGTFAPSPFETVDAISGNLVLHFTDLALPGNAGFGLRFVRSYNSNSGTWRFGLAGFPLRFVYVNGTSLSDIDFIRADGGNHPAQGAGDVITTEGFWKFTKATRKLELPNGYVLTYDHLVANDGGYLTEIRDPFDNVVTLTWQSGAGVLQSVMQQLGGGNTRTITFAGWSVQFRWAHAYGRACWT